MPYMFAWAYDFSNQDLSSWNVLKVTNHEFFFEAISNTNTEPNW